MFDFKNKIYLWIWEWKKNRKRKHIIHAQILENNS